MKSSKVTDYAALNISADEKSRRLRVNYGRCSKIWNTSCLPKKSRQNNTDPDQTAFEEAV